MDTTYKLNPSLHPDFTTAIIRKLGQNRIITLKDFLQEDPEKISNITTLTISCVLNIRESIFKQFSAPVINGTSLLQINSTKTPFLPTGVACLDEVLCGGIPIGFLTEICGLAGSGKSQLCMQLAINTVKNNDNTVLYIDTKGDFSAVRMQKVLEICGFSNKEMAVIMSEIKVVYVWSMEEMITLLQEIKNKNIIYNRLSLIIIDSLPCLMFQHFGDDNKIGLKFLNIFVNHARYLCAEHNIALVCVNVETRWIDQDNLDVDDDISECSTSKDVGYVEKKNRCLGKYWQNIPLRVIFLEKSLESSDNYSNKINATVLNYNRSQNPLKCCIEIGPTGVT